LRRAADDQPGYGGLTDEQKARFNQLGAPQS
jgi:hypothetical protein